jgi:hypothetical protein
MASTPRRRNVEGQRTPTPTSADDYDTDTQIRAGVDTAALFATTE